MKRYYPLILYLVSLGIILSVTLASWRYYVGTDVHLEAYFANQALNGWDASIAHPGNSAIGDVLLAPLYNNWLWFKFACPMIFAFVPVILYFTYKRYFTETESFLAGLFFISIPTFTMELPMISRQMFAEFWFALFLFGLLSDKGLRYKMPFLIATGGLTILSHYSLGIVLIIIAVAFWLITTGFRIFKQKLSMPIWATGIVVLALIVIGVAYYGNVADGTPLKYMAAIVPFKFHIGNYPIGYMPDEVITGTVATGTASASAVKVLSGGRDDIMKAALGLDFITASGVGKAYRLVQFITFGLLIVGAVYSLISKRMRRILKPEYVTLILISGGILLLCVLSPVFAAILNGTRWYHIALFGLAPMLVVGMKLIFGGYRYEGST